MNSDSIEQILAEHRIHEIRSTCVVCECGLRFEDEEQHRRHVSNRLWTWANGESGIEYLRCIIARTLAIHSWDEATSLGGKVYCPCGHESDSPLAHNRHVCEELADAIIDTESEWNVK